MFDEKRNEKIRSSFQSGFNNPDETRGIYNGRKVLHFRWDIQLSLEIYIIFISVCIFIQIQLEYTAVGTGDRCCVFINESGFQIGKSADFITDTSRFAVQKSCIFFVYNDCFNGFVADNIIK